MQPIVTNTPYLINDTSFSWLKWIYITEIYVNSECKPILIKAYHKDLIALENKEALVSAIHEHNSNVQVNSPSYFQEIYIEISDKLEIYSMEQINIVIVNFQLHRHTDQDNNNDHVNSSVSQFHDKVDQLATIIKEFKVPDFNNMNFLSSDSAIKLVEQIIKSPDPENLSDSTIIAYNTSNKEFSAINIKNLQLLYSGSKPSILICPQNKVILNKVSISDIGDELSLFGDKQSLLISKIVDNTDLIEIDSLLYFSPVPPIARQNSVTSIRLLSKESANEFIQFLKDIKIALNLFELIMDCYERVTIVPQSITNKPTSQMKSVLSIINQVKHKSTLEEQYHFRANLKNIILKSGIDKFINVENNEFISGENNEHGFVTTRIGL